jgi:hypothetical protein
MTPFFRQRAFDASLSVLQSCSCVRHRAGVIKGQYPFTMRCQPESAHESRHLVGSAARRAPARSGLLLREQLGGLGRGSPPAGEIAAAVIPGAEHVMEFHMVVKGRGWAAIRGETPVRLEAGDIVLFPHRIEADWAP